MEVMRSSQEVLLTIVEVGQVVGCQVIQRILKTWNHPGKVCVHVFGMQVLLYDPLFDWTMNPLKAFYLQQQDEQAELNATLNPTPAGEDPETHRKPRFNIQTLLDL